MYQGKILVKLLINLSEFPQLNYFLNLLTFQGNNYNTFYIKMKKTVLKIHIIFEINIIKYKIKCKHPNHT